MVFHALSNDAIAFYLRYSSENQNYDFANSPKANEIFYFQSYNEVQNLARHVKEQQKSAHKSSVKNLKILLRPH